MKKKSAPVALRLGTRASNLALTQSRMIARMIEKKCGVLIDLVEVTTTGDTVTQKPLKSFGGAGVFVKELESALADKRIDLAVHSLKDMPTRQPRGLILGAIVGREDPRDVAIVKDNVRLEELPPGSVIGSGSQRRRAQLKKKYPHLEFAEIRGNVETRIKKVQDGQYAGTILARAGLKRLGLAGVASQTFPLSMMLPAPGQGALGIECRSNDTRVRKLLKSIHNPEVAACVTAERAVLEALGGGCHLPLGALGAVQKSKVKGQKSKESLQLRAFIGTPDGLLSATAEGTAWLKGARPLGRRVAKLLLARGGKKILAAIK